MTSVSVFQLLISFTFFFHYFNFEYYYLILIFVSIPLCLYGWFSDIILESTVEGNHTKAVQQNINFGMILFIASEVMFFFAFFFAFFHFSLSPSI
jgi:cytochrome c oxidase subunit 3